MSDLTYLQRFLRMSNAPSTIPQDGHPDESPIGRRHRDPRQGTVDGPSIWDVATYVFKRYADDESSYSVYCVLCNRVLLSLAAGQIEPLELHFSTCRRQTYVPGDRTRFRCGPCNVSTRSFNHWRMFHVSSASHRLQCNGHHADRLYSNTCYYCDTVFYDTKKSIVAHVRAHREPPFRTATTSNGQQHKGRRSSSASSPSSYEYEVSTLSAFMAYVYDMRFSHSGVYYCGNCEQWTNDHSLWWCCKDYEKDTTRNSFYCPSCQATFAYCYRLDFKWHLSSAEHIALEFATEKNRAGGHRMRGDPMNIVWRYFGREDRNVAKVTCRVCQSPVRAGDRRLLEHWHVCSGPHWDNHDDKTMVTESYEKFYCGMCWTTITGPGPWSRHVLSLPHLTTCREIHNYQYRECAECHALFYGTLAQIKEHHDTFSETGQHVLWRLDVDNLMRYVFDELNVIVDNEPVTFFYRQSTNNFGRCNRATDPVAVPHYCPTCRLEFYGDKIMFREHAITVEHLLLRAFSIASLQPSTTPMNQSPPKLKLPSSTLKLPVNVTKPSQSPVKPSQSPVKPSESPVKPSQSPVKPSQSPTKPSQSLVKLSPSPMKPSSIPIKQVSSVLKLPVSSIELSPSPSPLEPRPVSVTTPTSDEEFGRYVAARLQTVPDGDTKAKIKLAIEVLIDSNS